MTIEAINELKKYTLGKKNTEKVEINVLKLNRIIKALEQEPCEDAISRKWLKNAIHNFYKGLIHTPTEEDIQAYIYVAPSVTPPTKVGVWIEEEDFFGDIGYKCSICNEVFTTIEYEPNDSTMNYCPNCGSKMEEVI